MSPPLSQLRRATHALVRRVSGVDLSRTRHVLSQLIFRLDVLGERLEAIEGRLSRVEGKLGAGPSLDELLPPKTLMDLVGGADSFHIAGQVMFEALLSFADLSAEDSVLDIGCGCGRTARHLLRYLSQRGRYRGFDVVGESIRWCQTYLAPRHADFEFCHVDLFNGRYNPTGSLSASGFSFPYPDDSFDLAFLDSVFTHMFPGDVSHYLSELRRVLRPNGRVLCSFFALEDVSKEAMERTSSSLQFVHRGDGWYTAAPELPETALAYDVTSIRRLIEEQGLVIRKQRPGGWSGRRGPDVGPQQQDLFLAFKTDA